MARCGGGGLCSLVESGVRLITTSLVLVELGDGLSRIQYRQLASTFSTACGHHRGCPLFMPRPTTRNGDGNYSASVTTKNGA